MAQPFLLVNRALVIEMLNQTISGEFISRKKVVRQEQLQEELPIAKSTQATKRLSLTRESFNFRQ